MCVAFEVTGDVVHGMWNGCWTVRLKSAGYPGLQAAFFLLPSILIAGLVKKEATSSGRYCSCGSPVKKVRSVLSCAWYTLMAAI